MRNQKKKVFPIKFVNFITILNILDNGKVHAPICPTFNIQIDLDDSFGERNVRRPPHNTLIPSKRSRKKINVRNLNACSWRIFYLNDKNGNELEMNACISEEKNDCITSRRLSLDWMSVFKIPLTALSDCLVLRSIFWSPNNVHNPITVHTLLLYTVRPLAVTRLDGSVRFGTLCQRFDPDVANEIFTPRRRVRCKSTDRQSPRNRTIDPVITPAVVRLRYCVVHKDYTHTRM